MTLWHEQIGSGPDLVLVHGWGLHGGIWGDLPQVLAQRFRVTTLDLPGHGRSRRVHGDPSLDALTDRLAQLCRGSSAWFGWSLGGLIALNMALRHPQQVNRLVLVSTTPKFVQAADWPHAMPEDDFTGFAAGFQAEPRAALLRFLSLHAGTTGEAERAVLRHMRREAFAHGDPKPAALAAGLNILKHTDLRTRLAEIRVPALVLQGSHDRLVPPPAGHTLAAQMPAAVYRDLDGAGHAPFLSRPREFQAALTGILA